MTLRINRRPHFILGSLAIALLMILLGLDNLLRFSARWLMLLLMMMMMMMMHDALTNRERKMFHFNPISAFPCSTTSLSSLSLALASSMALAFARSTFFIFIFTKKQQLQKFSLSNGQVPYTLTGELFPQQTRAWGCGLSLAARFLAQFVQLKV